MIIGCIINIVPDKIKYWKIKNAKNTKYFDERLIFIDILVDFLTIYIEIIYAHADYFQIYLIKGQVKQHRIYP